MSLSKTQLEMNQTTEHYAATRQKRVVKSVILRRASPDEDWGLRITGNGWQDGEWMSKNDIYLETIRIRILISKL